jgi:hypothetical protein
MEPTELLEPSSGLVSELSWWVNRELEDWGSPERLSCIVLECKIVINPIVNPIPVYGHITRDNMNSFTLTPAMLCLLNASCLAASFFHPEHGSNKLLRNVGELLSDYTVSHTRRCYSSAKHLLGPLRVSLTLRQVLIFTNMKMAETLNLRHETIIFKAATCPPIFVSHYMAWGGLTWLSARDARRPESCDRGHEITSTSERPFSAHCVHRTCELKDTHTDTVNITIGLRNILCKSVI